MLTLFHFQERAVEHVANALKTHRRVLLVAPTGTGKSVMASAIMRDVAVRAQRDIASRILFLCHRNELITQTCDKLQRNGLRYGIIKSGYPMALEHMLQVGSIQTFRSRVKKQLKDIRFDFIILDEVHRREYRAIDELPDAKIVGMTATPQRYGGKTLHGEYDHMEIAISYHDALANGYIVPARIFAPPPPDLSSVGIKAGDYDEMQAGHVMGSEGIMGDIVHHWRKHANNKPTILFSCSIAHGHFIHNRLNREGIPTTIVTSEDSAEERAHKINSYREGIYRVICNVGIFVEGYDAPETECIILARPTKSVSLYMQMTGRGCRPSPGKSHYIILDHAGNVYEHGRPDEDRDWTLEPNRKRRASPEVKIRICEECRAVLEGGSNQCEHCGYVFPVTSRSLIPSEIAGELKEITQIDPPPQGFIPWKQQQLRYFAAGRQRGMDGAKLIHWVAHKMSAHSRVKHQGKTYVNGTDPWRHTATSSTSFLSPSHGQLHAQERSNASAAFYELHKEPWLKPT